MPDEVIENPILNGPFEEPSRHWRFGEDGILAEVEEGRRPSGYFLPIARARTDGQASLLEADETGEALAALDDVNDIRTRVRQWRSDGWPSATPTTRRLLEYWSDPDRDNPLFFAQREAVETAIWLTEFAPTVSRLKQAHVDRLTELAATYNPGLRRAAFKLATGAGKTTIMAMLIAWQTCNRVANPQATAGAYTDAFLLVTPGITIKDRLQELQPSHPGSTYRQRDLMPPDLRRSLDTARIVITNYHAFLHRERVSTGKLTREVLHGSVDSDAFKETDRQMVERVLRDLGGRRQIMVFNDEAHHCYVHASNAPAEEAEDQRRLKGHERKEAKENSENARVWSGGLTTVAEYVGIRQVYDLSATPFFLAGSGYDEGALFPWVVSDFALIDAIEAGLVKIPRVPVADDAMAPEGPTYRDLWVRVGDDLRAGPRRRTEIEEHAPVMPAELEGALHSLYGHYEQTYRQWEQAGAHGTPPVFIVVCSDTTVSKRLYDWIAGWDRATADDDQPPVAVPGALSLFSNVHEDGSRRERPVTVLLDSRELDSGGAMSSGFKRVASDEIEAFKSELRTRFPGRDVEDLTDEDLLREVMNTVGKERRLGAHLRCVVSVSMLTEGWDANTVTHVLGVRAFSTQLLCEQVVGRALRRRSYETGDDGRFPPEYADVYGVPFSFLPTAGTAKPPPPPKPITRVQSLPQRFRLAITMPLLAGYRREVPAGPLEADFSEASLTLRPTGTPIRVQVAPVVGEEVEHTLESLRSVRPQKVAFELAAAIVDRHVRTADGDLQPGRFPQVLRLTRQWLGECLELTDNAFVGMLLLSEHFTQAVDLIGAALRRGAAGEGTVEAVLRDDAPVLTTHAVDFDTTRPVLATAASHVSHVAADSGTWERKAALALEQLAKQGDIEAYVRNDHLGFLIPYQIGGLTRQYEPDFVVRANDALHVVIEVSGRERHDKTVKVATTRDLWVPAVNRHGGFGRWALCEVTDPDTTATDVRAAIEDACASLAVPA